MLVGLLSVLVAVACGESSGPATSSSVIGPGGGTVEAGGASVRIPPGALSEDTEIGIARISGTPSTDPFDVTGDAFAFTPHGIVFAAPVQIEVPFEGGAGELALLRMDNETSTNWSVVNGAGFDSNRGIATHLTSTFSVYTVGRCVSNCVVGSPSYFSGVALDEERNRIIAWGGEQKALAIDLSSGAEDIFIAASPAQTSVVHNDRLLGIGGDGIFALDLTSDEISRVVDTSLFVELTFDLVGHDTSGSRLLYHGMIIDQGVTPTGYFPEGVTVQLRAASVETGNTSVLSDPSEGTGVALSTWLGGIVVDTAAGRALLAEGDLPEGSSSGSVIRITSIDLATGNRSIIATGIGDDPMILGNSVPAGMAIDEGGTTVYVGDRNQRGIHAVNLSDGTWATVTGGFLGVGTGPEITPTGIAYDGGSARLIVCGWDGPGDSGSPVIMTVDLSTGIRELLWSGS